MGKQNLFEIGEKIKAIPITNATGATDMNFLKLKRETLTNMGAKGVLKYIYNTTRMRPPITQTSLTVRVVKKT